MPTLAMLNKVVFLIVVWFAESWEKNSPLAEMFSGLEEFKVLSKHYHFCHTHG